MSMMSKVVHTAIAAVLIGAPMTAYAQQRDETTVYVHTTIPLDKGKPNTTAGASYSHTNGGGTTTVDVSTNGKQLNVDASHTQQHR